MKLNEETNQPSTLTVQISAQQAYCIEEYWMKYAIWDSASSFGWAMCTQHVLELELLNFLYYYILVNSCDK